MESTVAKQKQVMRERIRKRLTTIPIAWGKVAENLRNQNPYQLARCVWVSLHPGLKQIRLNLLADQKHLVLPTPGLQKGFRLLQGAAIPVRKRAMAVTPSFLLRSGRHLPCRSPLSPRVDLMITDALAVAEDGSLLGDGSGHLDLQFAILAALGWLADTVQVLAVVDPVQIVASFATEDHDVHAHWIVTEKESLPGTSGPDRPHPIQWERLESKAIRRSEPLFFLIGEAGRPTTKDCD